ncbi:MAG: SDR family oxidoreductase [Pseudomonadales bacterium]
MKTALITGANRGLGLEWVQQLAAREWVVYASCRQLAEADRLNAVAVQFPDRVRVIQLDLSNESEIAEVGLQFASEPLDLLINNAGYFGTGTASDASAKLEQDFENINSDDWHKYFQINCIAPMVLSRNLLGALSRAAGVILATSSRLSSITQNDGGLHAYRSSKTALNAAMASLAIDTKPLGIDVFIVSPGWVKTEMGGSRAPVKVTESVQGMIAIVENRAKYQSGSFIDYQGNLLPW